MKTNNNKVTTTKKEDKVMSTKKNEKKDTKKAKVEKKQEVKVEETKVEEVKVEVPAVEEPKKANKEKKAKTVSVPQFTNSEFKKLFVDNGCITRTNAKDTSNVVYNTFGTESRILQQTKGYQLLLVNGHKMIKKEICDVDYNDVVRFKAWYDGLTPEQKAFVVGDVDLGKLSDSEFPREKTVKITSLDLLIDFIKYMATFDENKVVVA